MGALRLRKDFAKDLRGDEVGWFLKLGMEVSSKRSDTCSWWRLVVERCHGHSISVHIKGDVSISEYIYIIC